MTTLAAGVLTGKSLLLAPGLAMFQYQDSINSGNSKLLMIFIGLAALALLIQAIAVVAVALGAMKAQKVIMGHIDEIKAKVMPLVEKSHGLVDDLGPKVKEITAKTNTLIGDLSPKISDITAKVQTLVADLSPEIVGITQKVHAIAGHAEQVTAEAKTKVLSFGPTVDAANETARQANDTVRATILDASGKTRAQVDRVNGLVTGAIDTTVRIVKAIEHGITQPAREVSGFVSGAKSTVEDLVKRYGGSLSFSSLASLVGLGKKKAPPAAKRPSPYSAAKPASPTEVNVHSPVSMGTSSSGLPSAFGSTRRDLDL